MDDVNQPTSQRLAAELRRLAHHDGGVASGAQRGGGEGVERGADVELLRAQVVRHFPVAVAEAAADGAALVPSDGKRERAGTK